MDAVELNYPVDVSAVAAKLVGSEGFGGERVTVTGVVEPCESGRVSLPADPGGSIERCSSFLRGTDSTSSVNASELSSLVTVPDSRFCRGASQLTSFPYEKVSKERHCSGTSGHLSVHMSEEGKVQKRAGKVSKNNSGCSKRPRIAQLEDDACPAVVDDTKDLSDKQGFSLIKCESHEKTQLTRQKNNCGSKRGDRRSSKVSMKSKYDSFSLKAGFASFGSAAGGNNIFALYGLKTDVQDFTELVGDLSLNDLLDGTYECCSLGKDKGKQSTNMSESILSSVRKACSVLQLPRPVQSENLTEIDSCSTEKPPMCPSSSISVVLHGENGDSSSTDLSSSNKDSRSKFEAHANYLDFPFYQPKDTLERLALPAPKDLESLLLKVAKPAVSSRNAPDPRPVKLMCRQGSLPPFPWSHTFGTNHRTNSDAVKYLTSRSTCQGRWVGIGRLASPVGAAFDCPLRLESLTYDETLVPSYGPKSTVLENNLSSVSLFSCGWDSSLTAAPVISQSPLECGGDLKHKGKVEQCPGILEAAQTLCDMASHISRLNMDGMMRWPKKPSQKVMKARKSKSNEKPEEIFAASTSVVGPANIARRNGGVNQIMTSKRSKLSTAETKKDLDLINGVRKGPITCITQKSNRSSPNKSVRDTIGETRHSAANIVKQPSIMPPPSKVLDRTYNGQQKVRKLMRMDWNRERDRLD